MSKTVKLEDHVYQELENELHPRETFSQAIFRLICLNKQLHEMLERLSGKKTD